MHGTIFLTGKLIIFKCIYSVYQYKQIYVYNDIKIIHVAYINMF